MFSYDKKKSEIYLYDVIGDPDWGMIGAEQVINALSEMQGQRVTLRLNTPGGSIDEGVAIYNALKRHDGGVDTVVDGVAASMGSYILLAGERRTAAKNSMVMIHNPMTIAFGNAIEFRKTADILDKYLDRMLPDYSARTGKSEEELRPLLDAETWYVGSEIIENGFADELDELDAKEPTMRGMKTIAARSIAEGRAPRMIIDPRPLRSQAVLASIDPCPRKTAVKIALMQMEMNQASL